MKVSEGQGDQLLVPVWRRLSAGGNCVCSLSTDHKVEKDEESRNFDAPRNRQVVGFQAVRPLIPVSSASSEQGEVGTVCPKWTYADLVPGSTV